MISLLRQERHVSVAHKWAQDICVSRRRYKHLVPTGLQTHPRVVGYLSTSSIMRGRVTLEDS